MRLRERIDSATARRLRRGFVAAAIGAACVVAPATVLALVDGPIPAAGPTVEVRVTGNLPGWNDVWVNRDVAVSIVAVSTPPAPVFAAYKYWSDDVAEPAEFAVASSDATGVVITEEGTTTLVAGYVLGTEPVSGQVSRRIRIDKTAPVVGFSTTANLASGWTSATVVPLTIKAHDAVSGIRGDVRYVVERNGVRRPQETTTAGSVIPVTGDGRYAVFATADDLAGNVSPSTVTTFGIDTVAPLTTWTRKATFDGQAKISLRATDAHSGVKAIYYRLDGETTQTGASLTVTPPAGTTGPVTRSISFWSEDHVGNIETVTAASRDVTFTILPDLEPPTTVASADPAPPITAWRSSDTTVTLVADDGASGVGAEHTFFRMGDGAVTTYTAPFRVSDEGSTRIEYWSVDRNANREAARTADVRIDRTLPVSFHDAAARYTGTAAISIGATDVASGVASIRYWIDKSAPQDLVSYAAGAAYMRGLVKSTAAGTHSLSWVVTDVAGNRESTQTVTFHVTRRPKVVMSTKSARLRNTSTPAYKTIKGRLMDGTRAMGGKRVILEFASTSTFSKKKTVSATTASNGRFSFKTKLSSRTYYRVVFKREADYEAATGAKVKLMPRVWLSSPSGRTSQRADRRFTVTGKVRPAHTSKSKVYVKRYLLVKGKPVYKGMVRAVVTSKGTYSTYRCSLKLGRGTWRLRAYARADAQHARSWSSKTKYLTVKVGR